MSNDSHPQFELPKIIDEYELTELLGKGSFSHVYKAKNLKKDGNPEFYGIKVISKKNLNQDGDTERLHREVDAMTSLDHENIVKLHRFFNDKDFYYLVLDFCPGGTVYSYISSGNRLREPQAANIFLQIVEAIDYCHNHNFAHRDLKLQNILFTTFPNIKISDFGLCSYINEDTKMSTFCGSPCYSAPECINHIDYDGKLADIWSLGVILFELVTSSHPWNVENVPQMVQQITNAQYTIPAYVTSACADLIESMLKVKCEERIDLESIMIHPWLKIASKRSVIPENSNGNPEANVEAGSSDNLNAMCEKSSLPPLRRLTSMCDADLTGEKKKNGLSVMIPHSAINIINTSHFDLAPKMRVPIGSRALGQNIPTHLKRRISLNQNYVQNEDLSKIQPQVKKKGHDSYEPSMLKW
ncbi:hypothetical protein M9Y10_038017 [Tritrichomonas musculus]|uniref:Protein kinase domain-containing protein n=1 Tax=Tritrichomonas musculus TaxID=1915356 RepID=A0ABR2K931_9EUKA